MTKLYIYAGIIILTILLGLGAIWQHNRYVALSQQFEALQEANRGLAEASVKAEEASRVKDKAAQQTTKIILDSNKRTQERVSELAEVVNKGTTDEKALMSSPLPPDVVRVLDSTYQDRN